MPKRAIIIGGGLAGLAAARELARSGLFEVTLLEVESEIGGRAHTKMVNKTAVDFGGFIIYPWYKHFHRYLHELGLEKELASIPHLPIFYDIEGNGKYTEDVEQLHHPFSRWKFFRQILLPALLFQNSTHPNLNAFKRKTVHDLLRSCQHDPNQASNLEEFFDTVSQGYCYGPLNEYKAAFGIPVIVQSQLYGDVSKSMYLKEGLQVLTTALVKDIQTHNGTVRVNAPALDIDIEKRQVQLASETLEADIVIFAQPYNNLTKKALGNIEENCTYTHFAVVTAQFNKTPIIEGRENWGAIFYKRNRKESIQTLSSINLSTLYGHGLSGYVNLNVRFDNPSLFPIKSELQEILHDQLEKLFPDAKLIGIEECQFWTNTMPLSSENLVEHVRKSQGKDGYFYAGDYLGCPSMETALASGIYAANKAIAQHR